MLFSKSFGIFPIYRISMLQGNYFYCHREIRIRFFESNSHDRKELYSFASCCGLGSCSSFDCFAIEFSIDWAPKILKAGSAGFCGSSPPDSIATTNSMPQQIFRSHRLLRNRFCRSKELATPILAELLRPQRILHKLSRLLRNRSNLLEFVSAD